MPSLYLESKHIGRGHCHKSDDELVMQKEDLQAMLDACEADQMGNPRWKRDWMIIFLGCALGMRRGEIHLYERKHFRDLEKDDVIYAPTLKQSGRIEYVCVNPQCKTANGEKRTRFRLKLSRSGQQHQCIKCGTWGTIPTVQGDQITGVVEKEIDIVEGHTKDAILDYLDNHMRPDQVFLFEPNYRPGEHICDGHVNKIFNTYLAKANLNLKYSYHSLRHARGMFVYTLFRDFKAVQKALRHKDPHTATWYSSHDADEKQRMKEEMEKANPLKKMTTRKKKGVAA